MSKRSLQLEGKKNEILSLLRYLKQQSGMKLLELECKFTPHKDYHLDGSDNGGRQFSRWILGNAQPALGSVQKIYSFVCDQLINGNWRENGNEHLWAPLLPCVIDKKRSFLIEKRSILLRILEQFDEKVVSKKLLHAISTGYYIPSEDEIRNIFWSKENSCADGNWCNIFSGSDDEFIAMKDLVTDILGNFGISRESVIELNEVAKRNGFRRCDLDVWADQLYGQIQLDAQMLSEMSWRANHVYPCQFIDASPDSLGEDWKKANKDFFKMLDQLEFANSMLNMYAESTKSVSKASMKFGLLTQLSYEHYVSNGRKMMPSVFYYPTVSIL